MRVARAVQQIDSVTLRVAESAFGGARRKLVRQAGLTPLDRGHRGDAPREDDEAAGEADRRAGCGQGEGSLLPALGAVRELLRLEPVEKGGGQHPSLIICP